MVTVWKFVLSTDGACSMPEGAKVLYVSDQRGYICLWAQVHEGHKLVERQFLIVGTGSPLVEPAGKSLQYIGSAMQDKAMLVWHVYEVLDR